MLETDGSMALHTALYDWHVAHGGRMVEFGGWDMPIQYTTIVEEHDAVRKAAGVFDVSHMGRFSFAGPGALGLIQHVWTNNAATLHDGQVRYGLVLNDQGGVRDDILVYRWPYGYAMVVNASNRDKIVGVLEQHRTGREVQFEDQTRTTAMFAVQGPKALDLVRGLTDVDAARLAYYHAAPTRCLGQQAVVSRTGYTGEDGVEIMIGAANGVGLWEELVRRGARPCGLGARDTLRLEAGMPLYGHELTETLDPLQAGLGWAVKIDKGDFVGRAALVQRQQVPTRRVRIGLELTGRRLAREGARISQDGREVGLVTSGTFAPTLQKALAMAYVDPSLAGPGTALEVDVRGKAEAARVVALPFYRRPRPKGTQ
jgi:aminomethyltransferase